MKYKNLKDVFFASKFHVGKGMATYDTSLDATVFDALADMNAIVASEVAMNAVVNSELAMNAVANSEVAMNAVANSEVAMNAVLKSEVARFTLTNSQYLQQKRNTIVNTLERGVSKGLFVKYSAVNIDSSGKYNSTSNWACNDTITPDNSIAIIKAAGPYTDGNNATTRIKHLQNPNVVVFTRSGTAKLQSVDNYVCIGGLIHEETGDSLVRIDGYEAV